VDRSNTVVNRNAVTGRNEGRDLTGMAFGKLRIIGQTGSVCRHGYKIWRAECACGDTIERPSYRFVHAAGRKTAISCPKCAPRGRPRLPNNHSHVTYIWNHIRRGAIDRGIIFELTPEQVREIVSQDCTYCGEPPQLRTIHNLAGSFSWTGVDRIDSDEGYVTGNVAPCCGVCNTAKNDMPLMEFEEWVARVYRNLRKRKRPPIVMEQRTLDFSSRRVAWDSRRPDI
jgi:hypothetical protein